MRTSLITRTLNAFMRPIDGRVNHLKIRVVKVTDMQTGIEKFAYIAADNYVRYVSPEYTEKEFKAKYKNKEALKNEVCLLKEFNGFAFVDFDSNSITPREGNEISVEGF